MEMFDKILEGKIKALYIFGEDPFITLPNLERLKNGLRQLELLVVQDHFHDPHRELCPCHFTRGELC